MANAQVGYLGLSLIALGVLGYFIPATPTGLTVLEVTDLCESGMGQLGQTFSGDVQKICREYSYLMYGIYGSVIIGIILMIVGAVKSGSKDEAKHDDDYEEELEDKYEKGKISLGEFVAKTKNEEEDDSLEILKKRYAKGEISKEEFENMKKDLENS